MTVTLHHGNCLDVLRGMPDNSVDSIVTDPPYGLDFMGKDWDHGVPCVATWKEALRVLKPGGHLLSFGGSRMYHRMACAVEDAGFEIRDQIMWVYGSGFPKSHNGDWGGTALKPAHEPIVMARKPLIGTVEKNWSVHGTGALNIAGCRVGDGEDRTAGGATGKRLSADEGYMGAWSDAANGRDRPTGGRWPANLIHDGSDEVLAGFPVTTSGGGNKSRKGTTEGGNCYGTYGAPPPDVREVDTGSAARFFYCAKANKKDRDEGLAHMDDKLFGMSGGAAAAAARGEHYDNGDGGVNRTTLRKNNHPTVKPTDLMAYLCRLVTPAGGVVLDPFTGSGSTGKAAVREGFRFIGIEREAAYLAIAQARIDHELVGDLL